MTEEERQQLINDIIDILVADSQQVSDIEIVNSLNNISSLPAIKSGTTEDSVVRAPISLLIPEMRYDNATNYVQYKQSGGEWTNLYLASESGEGTGSYINQNPIIQKIGALSKGDDFSLKTNLQILFDKIFFPNLDNQFPSNPIFIGISPIDPYIQNIIQLDKPTDFYKFDFNKYVDIGYIVIALPGNYYLKKIENDGGLNIINSFYIKYKSILVNGEYEIYNVYVSPLLKYHSNVELTLYTKLDNPINATLNDFILSLDNITPTINSIIINQGIKSILNNIDISIRNIPVNINNIQINTYDKQPLINSLQINNRDIPVILNTIVYNEGIKAKLNSIAIKSGLSILNSVTISQGKSIINSIKLSDGRSILNGISFKDGRAILNKITINKL